VDEEYMLIPEQGFKQEVQEAALEPAVEELHIAPALKASPGFMHHL
jgi:hypothetical protein